MDRMLRNGLIAFALTATGLIAAANPANAQTKASRTSAVASPSYFTATPGLHMERSVDGVLTVTFNTRGGPYKFSAADHEAFVDAFYSISRDRANKVVILTGAGGEWIGDIDFASFGDVSDPDGWSKVHDEGAQALENLLNIRVPVICAVEGKAWVHSEYCLTANVVIAAAGATFNDAPHFAGGIVPGDGIFTAWSYYAGPGRAQAWLLDPKPISAQTAQNWGVVAEVTPNGGAVARANALAAQWLKAPEVTRRNTRIHFVQPLKERIIRETGYGLQLEGSSASAVVKASKGAVK
ncbi:MAG: enoyl-CoA hydratase/isomerase family protein [Sphingomonas sp.]|nr:enoyl-CoA hydratase/isomerase family protein [Sphingomonas sp.]